jgi:hypothetical protein
MSMLSDFWKNPIIKINKKNESCPQVKLGESTLKWSSDEDTWFSTYENVLLSGSAYTGDKLMSQEKMILDKIKKNFKSHEHTHMCETDEEKEDKACDGDKWEQVWGCTELEDSLVTEKVDDVIDRLHWIHIHKMENERFRHFKKAKELIQNCRSWKAILRQLKKIKKLKNLLA